MGHNIKKSNQKVSGRLKQTSLQRKHADNQEAYEKMINITIREIQIKTTMRYHLIQARMSIIKRSANNKCWRGCREKGTLLYFWWECKLVQPLGEIAWRFLKKLNIGLP